VSAESHKQNESILIPASRVSTISAGMKTSFQLNESTKLDAPENKMYTLNTTTNKKSNYIIPIKKSNITFFNTNENE